MIIDQTKEGHEYSLQNFENPSDTQTLRFIYKAPVSPGSTELETIQDGTTNEEVLQVLIHRLQFLGAKMPSRENAIALTHIETALLWLKKRTQDRLERGVEGTMAK